MGIFEIMVLLILFLAILFLPGWWARRRKHKRADSQRAPDGPEQT